MLCDKCGSTEADSSLFCTKCGARLGSEAPVIPFVETGDAALVAAENKAADAASVAPDGGSPFAGAGGANVVPDGGSPAADTVVSSNAAPDGGSPFAGGGAYARGASNANNDWMGIVAIVCGIASLPCCFTCFGGAILGAAGIVFGILGLNTKNRQLAIAGIVCGALGAFASIAMMLAFTGLSALYESSDNIREFIEKVPNSIEI